MSAGDPEQRREDDCHGGYLETEVDQGMNRRQGSGGDADAWEQAVITALPDAGYAKGNQPAKQANHQGEDRNNGLEGKFEITVRSLIQGQRRQRQYHQQAN